MLSEEDRNMMIEYLMMTEGCARQYWERQPDNLIQKNYVECCLTESGE